MNYNTNLDQIESSPHIFGFWLLSSSYFWDGKW